MATLRLEGVTFGRLTVVHEVEGARGRSRWLCRCACGADVTVSSSHLRSGATKSCGCLRRELSAERRTASAAPFESRLREDPNTGCIEWQGSRDRDGYGTLRSGRKDHKAHRVAYEKAHGPIARGLSVCHRCDNPPCCNPAHLFLGTPRDNTHDAVRKGRNARGARNGHTKLNDAAVRHIRALVADGRSQEEVGRLYGVGQTAISSIVRRRTWAHVS